VFAPEDDDEQKKRMRPAPQQGGSMPMRRLDAAADGDGYMRTFQAPNPGVPDQRSRMPWSGASQMGGDGGPTPWAQAVQAPPGAPAPGPMMSSQAQGAGGGMQPNWEALQARFGGAQAQPMQRPQFGTGGGGMPLGGGRANPWLQQMQQRIAAAIAARRNGGGMMMPGVGRSTGGILGDRWGQRR